MEENTNAAVVFQALILHGWDELVAPCDRLADQEVRQQAVASPPGFPLGDKEEAVTAVDDLPCPGAACGEEVEGEVAAIDSDLWWR